MRARREWTWVERLLVIVGVVCLGWWTTAAVHGWYFRSQQISLFARVTKPANPATPPPPAVASPRPGTVSHRESPGPSGLVGILDVPRLGISTPVIVGDDERALDVAAGHLSDTPFPWEPGNSAVAAHRDGLFRPLRGVKRGDLVRMRTAHGDFEYTVRDTKIVEPDDLSVLAHGTTDSLTLITCYPFAYIGHAPQRFIVRAEREQALSPAAVQVAAVRVTTGNLAERAPSARSARAAKVKSKPAKTAKKQRVAARGVQKGATVSAHSRKAPIVRHPEQKDEPTKKKKRRWYRLFLG